jgi:hypothetical protein
MLIWINKNIHLVQAFNKYKVLLTFAYAKFKFPSICHDEQDSSKHFH